MSTAVHFHGIENIVAAFESKRLPHFAIVSGKQIIHKNDKITDIDEAALNLETFLEMLNQASNAIYTLKIYEEVPKGGIKENTPADYGLNFRLNMPGMLPEHQGRQVYYENRKNEMAEVLSELRGLKAKIQEMEEAEEDEEEEQPQGIGAIANNALAGMLNNPEVQNVIATKLAGFIGNLFNASGKPAPAALAGVPVEVSEETQDKIDTAIETLAANTPGGAEVLSEKLTKLAAMSESNNGQYQMLLKML